MPEGYQLYLTTFSIKDVTKIDVYYGNDNNQSYVVCIVFYDGEKILGAP